jgi:hypothetical protein
VCANCRAPLDGAFCAACGQKAAPIRQPVHHFLADAVVEYFGIDGRLWASLKLLLLQPGRLTQAYLVGRRVRYLRPLRLYLSATLVFFFLLALLDPVGRVQGLVADDELGAEMMPAGERVAEIDSALTVYLVEAVSEEQEEDSLRVEGLAWVVAADSLTVPELQGALTDLEYVLDSASRQRRLRQLRWQRDGLAAFPPDSLVRIADWERAAEIVFPDHNVNIDLPAWMPRSRPVQQLLEARTGEERGEAFADLVRNAIGQLPTVMFLLLPVFALLLKLIYVRRDWFYSEHLVFALHTHAFAFLVFAGAVVLLWAGVGTAWAGVTASLLTLGIPLYFFVAQKRVYGQGWMKTAVKALLLGWMYSFLLSVGLALAFMLASAV